MKNRLTLLHAYTSMLWFDALSWRACREDWHKLRSVSRQIYKHLESVYKNKGNKSDNLAENERLLTEAKNKLHKNGK